DLTSDDPDEGTYTITLNGTGTGPDINVQAGGLDVGTHDFGSSNVGVAVGPTTFTIQNVGTGPLEVSGFSLSAGDFSGSLATPVTIPASGSETFDITFTPTTTGLRSATIDLTSDDPDEGTYTITLNGTGTEPDINVQVGGSDVTTYDFGTVYQPLTSVPVIFTIQNTGGGSLNVTGSSLSGANATDFTVTGLTTGTMVSGGSSTFTVIFTPGGTGVRSASLSISSDDPNENPYDITLSGTGGSGATPEINLKIGATDYASGTGTCDFGDVYPGSAKTVSFTIENTGAGTLTLADTPLVGTTDFSVEGPDITVIPGYGSLTFTVTFIPSGAWPFADILTINSDDADEPAYTINLIGNGTAAAAPDIDVSINGTEYLTGSTYDFGDIQSGDSGTVTLIITNSGSTDLNIASDAMNLGTDYFETGPGSTLLAAGASTTLDVTFSPTAAGFLSDYIEIGSDDPDEPAYQITFTGNGTLLPVPDISVEAVSVARPSGGYFDFEALYGGSAVTVTFTIENLGNATLDLYAPYVALSGHQAGDYSITAFPSSTSIAPTGTTTFDVEFDPSAKGLREAAVMIPSNDPDEETYIINLNGLPVIPLMMVHGGWTPDTSVYDPTTNTFSAGVSMTDMVDAGGHSFLIDSGTEAGKYMVIHGAGGTTTTLYDPGVPPAAPTVSGTYSTVTNVDSGAHSFQITGGAHIGEYLVVCGATTTINLFNPATPGFEDATPYGINLGSSAYTGSFHFTNDDDDMVVIIGNNSAGYRVFDQDGTNTFGSLQSIPSAQIWEGGHGTRIISGMYPGYMLIIEGGLAGSDRTWLFDPSTSPTHAAGPSLSGNAFGGSFSIPIVTGPYAGRILVVHGNNGSATSIYNSIDNTMSAGPNLPTPAMSGAFCFKITGGPYNGWYKIMHSSAYLDTTLFDPETLQFTDEGETLWSFVGLGASTFPAR
ncbi:MAG: choice-of-anchor D domain-containing protein, partial [Spirochaetes bacterium]|nr:choice-of-anchor D domain-containing protein [Spirochaetota bacterium]